MIRLFGSPSGSLNFGSGGAIRLACGFATSNSLTSVFDSPFYSGGVQSSTHLAQYLNGVFAESTQIAHQFTITTSTSGTTTVYIYGFAGLFGISSPAVLYSLSVDGLFR